MLSGSQVSAFGYLPFSTLTKKPPQRFFFGSGHFAPVFVFWGVITPVKNV